MGTNSVQTMDVLQQGIGMFKDLSRKSASGSAGDGSTGTRAAMLEEQAQGNAQDIRRKAVGQAGEVRETREKERARRHAGWGGSNLAMSGSKQLIRDARRAQDMQAEEDVLFEGEMDARAELRDGRSRANQVRIGSGGSPRRSTLSMGSKIYQTRS